MDQSISFAKAIADETRQKIMLLLCCEWLCVNDVVDRLNRNVTQPTVSHHLSTLRDAGLVNTRREGKQIFYSLNQDAVAICCGQIMTMFAPEFSSGTIVEQATINASSPEAEVAIGV
ncbi:MAG: metalloregulator ArsR/SmtB family transcription factor [Chloroflexota bacterium]